MVKYAIVLAVALLLLFGCGGGTGGNGSAKGADNGAGGSGGSGGTDTGTGSGEASGGSGSAGPAFDVAEATMAEIISNGISVACRLETRLESGGVGEAKLYLRGNNFRYEEEYANGQEAVVIRQGDVIYTPVPEEQRATLGGCMWIKVPVTEGRSDDPVEDLKALSKSSYACSAASFGDEKFEVVGKACTMEEMVAIMQQAQGG